MGTPRIVTNNSIIINESCIWHKWVNSLEEYKGVKKTIWLFRSL